MNDPAKPTDRPPARPPATPPHGRRPERPGDAARAADRGGLSPTEENCLSLGSEGLCTISPHHLAGLGQFLPLDPGPASPAAAEPYRRFFMAVADDLNQRRAAAWF